MSKNFSKNSLLILLLALPALAAVVGFENIVPKDSLDLDKISDKFGGDKSMPSSQDKSDSYKYLTSNYDVAKTLSDLSSEPTLTFAANNSLNLNSNYAADLKPGFSYFGFEQLLNAADIKQAISLLNPKKQASDNLILDYSIPSVASNAPAGLNTLVSSNAIFLATIANQINSPQFVNASPGCTSGICGQNGQSGWVLTAFDIAVAGDTLQELGVANINDNIFQSGLAFVGKTLASELINSPTQVPVPAALPLMASALAVFGLSRRKVKSKNHNK